MLGYLESEFSKHLKVIFEEAAQSPGFDGVSPDPKVRGIEAVAEWATDYTLAAIVKGLGLENGSSEYKRILAAYVDGKQRIDISDFESVLSGRLVK